jgi:hypothetical protein
MTTYIKDPDAILDYGFDWSDWLQTNETITASTWGIDPSDSPGLDKQSDSFSDTATTIWLSGGEADEDYVVTNHITTSANREDDRSHKIKVRQR